jgi:O-Antigen ligase
MDDQYPDPSLPYSRPPAVGIRLRPVATHAAITGAKSSFKPTAVGLSYYAGLVFIVAVTTGHRYWLLEGRFEGAGIPINYVELIFVLLLGLALGHALFHRRTLRWGAFGWPALALAAVSLVGVVVGYLHGYPTYNLLQEMRTLLFFTLSYFAFLIIVPNSSAAFGMIRVGVISSAAPAAYMIGTFLLTGSRDIGVPIYFCVFSISVLLCVIGFRWPLIPQWLAWSLLLLTIGGILSSLNRGDWLGLCTAAAVVLPYLMIQVPRRALGIGLLVGLATLFVASFGLLYVDRYDSLVSFTERVDTLQELPYDLPYQSRLDETTEAWNLYTKGNLLVGEGLGLRMYRFMYLTWVTGRYVEVYYFHNSYIQYLLKTGLMGLAVIVWLLFRIGTAGLGSWRRRRWNAAEIAALSLSAGCLAWSVESFVGGLVSDPMITPFLGSMAALLSILLQEKGDANGIGAVTGKRPATNC